MQAQLSRRGPAGGRSSRLSRRPGLSERQAQELLHRQREHAEQEVAQHLAVATLPWPRTRTWRPPQSSFRRPLTRSTVERSR